MRTFRTAIKSAIKESYQRNRTPFPSLRHPQPLGYSISRALVSLWERSVDIGRVLADVPRPLASFLVWDGDSSLYCAATGRKHWSGWDTELTSILMVASYCHQSSQSVFFFLNATVSCFVFFSWYSLSSRTPFSFLDRDSTVKHGATF